MTITKAYDEVIDFIADSSDPHRLRDFHPSETAKMRAGDLVARSKAGALTADEASEIEHYLQLEHIMRLAKARAQRHLAA